MRFRNLASAMMVLAMTGSMAHAGPVTLHGFLEDPVWAKRFDSMFGKTPKPDWLNNATESGVVSVSLDGKPYKVLQACKRHDCSNHQIAVLFDNTTLYGLRFETTDNSAKEELIWLNIGGGPESIDGKTILYAAMTGSLFNHPEQFSLSSKKQ